MCEEHFTSRLIRVLTELSRLNLFSLFQIMTGEDWNAVMYDGIVASKGPHTITGILSSLYFVSLVILGNCILKFNLLDYIQSYEGVERV